MFEAIQLHPCPEQLPGLGVTELLRTRARLPPSPAAVSPATCSGIKAGERDDGLGEPRRERGRASWRRRHCTLSVLSYFHIQATRWVLIPSLVYPLSSRTPPELPALSHISVHLPPQRALTRRFSPGASNILCILPSPRIKIPLSSLPPPHPWGLRFSLSFGPVLRCLIQEDTHTTLLGQKPPVGFPKHPAYLYYSSDREESL